MIRLSAGLNICLLQGSLGTPQKIHLALGGFLFYQLNRNLIEIFTRIKYQLRGRYNFIHHIFHYQVNVKVYRLA